MQSIMISAVLAAVFIASRWFRAEMLTSEIEHRAHYSLRIEHGQVTVTTVFSQSFPRSKWEVGFSENWSPYLDFKLLPLPDDSFKGNALVQSRTGRVPLFGFVLTSWILSIRRLLIWRFTPLAPGECPQCRYDAAGLDACPECGKAITP